jgi:hypothetical protein
MTFPVRVVVQIQPADTPVSEGKYDLSTVEKLVDWRDTKR